MAFPLPAPALLPDDFSPGMAGTGDGMPSRLPSPARIHDGLSMNLELLLCARRQVPSNKTRMRVRARFIGMCFNFFFFWRTEDGICPESAVQAVGRGVEGSPRTAACARLARPLCASLEEDGRESSRVRPSPERPARGKQSPMTRYPGYLSGSAKIQTGPYRPVFFSYFWMPAGAVPMPGLYGKGHLPVYGAHMAMRKGSK